MGFVAFSGDHFGLGGLGIAGRSVCWTALTTTVTTLAASFTAALTALTAAFASGCTLVAHFGAIGVQLGLCIAEALATTLAAAFTRRTITCRSFGTFTPLSTFAACRTCFAFAQFVATFGTCLAAALTTSTTFTWRADFACRAFAALATTAVASTTATVTAAFTSFAIATAFAGFVATLAVATFSCFFVLLAHCGGCCFSDTATEQVFQPAKETTCRGWSDCSGGRRCRSLA